MHTSLQRLNLIKNKVKEIIDRKQLKTIPQIVAVSKTFSLKEIIPLLEMGHFHFGTGEGFKSPMPDGAFSFLHRRGL